MEKNNIRVSRNSEEITVANKNFRVTLSAKLGGFPSSIGFGDGEEIFSSNSPAISARSGGSVVYPVIRGVFNPGISRFPGAGKVTAAVHDISWEYASGEPVRGYRTSMLYEFWHDGAAYVKTFFYTDTLEPQNLKDFILEIRLPGLAGKKCEWANWRFSARGADAAEIQSFDCYERFIPKNDSRVWKKEILPFFSFDFGEGKRRDRHVEFFVECWNSLTADYRNSETEIQWVKNYPVLRWNFQKRKIRTPGRAFQWRNTWGWALSRFPEERPRMPLRIYHYLDNFKRYPDNAQIAAIAREDANLLIMHENWRLDAKQGEFAFSRRDMLRVSRACKKHGLRLALYVRGNEDAVVEDFGEALSPYLEYNFDGIYMDYGGPRPFTTYEDEGAPGGRMKMRAYDLKMRRVREFVGPEGVFISHTGSFFSAVGQTSCDTYLGGEQEKGRLIESRETHAYFSGLSVCAASLWTAAFPVYRSAVMLPFLACTAQAPFLHIGCQLPSSSLNHPHSPEAVNFVRPLWRLWKLFDRAPPFRVLADQNTGPRILGIKTAGTGACAFINKNGEGLIIAANFSAKPRRLRLAPDLKRMGVKATCGVLSLRAQQPCCPGYSLEQLSMPELSADAAGYGIAAWLFTTEPSGWKNRLKLFARPYPGESRAEKKYRKKIEDEKRMRCNMPAAKHVYLRAWIENFPNTYEDSLWLDLFENTLELVDISGAAPLRIGYVSMKGLTCGRPCKRDYLWPGRVSPWIALHETRGLRGRRKIALRTRKKEHEFYNFAFVELSDRPSRMQNPHIMEFCNEIDFDWSSLEFYVNIVGPGG